MGDSRECGHCSSGECRKQAALDHLEVCRKKIVVRGRRVILERLLAGHPATADDVQAAVKLPPGISPRCFGPVGRGLAQAGIIWADGTCKTSRPKAHARPVTVWRLADRSKAEQWLADHPDSADDDDLDGSSVAQHGPLSPAFPSVSTEPESAANIASMKGMK